MEREELNALLDKTQKEALEAAARNLAQPYSAKQWCEQIRRNNRAMGIGTG